MVEMHKQPQLGNVQAHKLAHQHDYSLNVEAAAYSAYSSLPVNFCANYKAASRT